MKPGLFLTCLLVWALPKFCAAQEYSYTRYDIQDGLAGSTVYSITQDRDGFIWASTETGVSRFDGVHFRNFTTNDGLPDVEILQLYADSRDRVWMGPFAKSICYYLKGKIHNQTNDPMLGKIRVQGLIEHFVEDRKGDILVQEPTCLHVISPSGTSLEIDSVRGRPIFNCHDAIEGDDGNYLVEIGDTVYHLADGLLQPLMTICFPETVLLMNYINLGRDFSVYRSDFEQTCIRSMKTGDEKFIHFEKKGYRHVDFDIIDDSLIFVNESAGATVYNARTLQHDHYLPGVEISHVFRDNDRNLWFATLGQGLYRLNSEEIRNFQLNGTRCHGCGVYAITKVDSQLLVGSARNSVFRYRLPDLGLLSAKQLNEEEKKRIMAIVPLKDGRLLFGTDFTLTIESGDFRPEGSLRMSVKSTCLLPQDKLLVGTGSGAFLADMHRMKVDTIWRGRTTAVYYSDSNIYIGTLNGLFRIPDGGTPYYMGKDDTRLSSRISGITGDGHGTMWVAPYDDMGVLELRDGKVVRRIGASEGLTSNICRVIALHGDYLWVGTDKGLNRINVVHPEQRIVKYTAGDGLGSNVINTVFFDSTRVYVGTSAGFNYFDETKIADSSTCRFAWLSVTANGRSRLQDTANLRFSYRASDFHFEFAGISYRSGGDISYRYRLTGLDTAWRMTQQNFLNYPVLPGGDYLLQVAAVDKWGHQSPVAGIHFIVSTPFWRQLWFFLTVGLAIVALAWLLMMKRIRRIRRRQEDERALMRRVNEMEHMALQAQMNPHFIFNCMNSIQQYIFDQDIFGANKYISGFSRLIRATLQHSNRPLITLGEEIDYLSNYLSLERLRFKEKMEYRFEVDEGIDRSECMIPPMIIQPFAENSIRHGLRHKRSGKGVIMIRMQQVDGYLIVTIEDNGIGRRKAAMYKTQEHIEYQSRGMSLTAERIKAMNSMYGRRIDFSVTDLEDEAGEPAGTRVRIRFPLNMASVNTNANDQNRFD